MNVSAPGQHNQQTATGQQEFHCVYISQATGLEAGQWKVLAKVVHSDMLFMWTGPYIRLCLTGSYLDASPQRSSALLHSMGPADCWLDELLVVCFPSSFLFGSVAIR